MNEDWLKSFLVFSEYLNFTHAAERLNISQPALHVKINKLADFLGAPLYHKIGRTLILTNEGKRVRAFAIDIQTHTQAFQDEFKGLAKMSQVVLSAGEGSYLYLLGPAITSFRRKNVSSLRLITGNREQTLESIRSGDAQVGVAVLHATPEDLNTELLTTVHQALVVPKNHALAKKNKIQLTDLEGERLILPPEHRPHRMVINQALLNKSVKWEIAIEAEGWELMIHFVALGMGLTIVNSCCKIPKGLTAIPIDGLPKQHYFIIRRISHWTSDAVNALCDDLLKHKNDWKINKNKPL